MSRNIEGYVAIFAEAFKSKYNYDEIDEAYFESDNFKNRVEELLEVYDGENVSKEQMAEDVNHLLYFEQYGYSSDANDVSDILEDITRRFPDGRFK